MEVLSGKTGWIFYLKVKVKVILKFVPGCMNEVSFKKFR